MKISLTLLMLFVGVSLYAQPNESPKKITEYTASNGVTYHIKDTVRLGMGSANNGSFNYIMLGGWIASMEGIGKGYTNTAVVIKSIKTDKIKGIERYYFVVGGGNITNYNLMIEEAISSCEVVPCTGSKNTQTIPDKYDQIKKLKALLDGGAITQDEYDSEKKKLLDQ